MCMLESFFCFELQTAGVIIGWLVTVKSLLALIFTSMFYPYIPSIIINGTIEIINKTDIDPGTVTESGIIEGLSIVFIALCAIDFIASVLLLYGSIQGKRLLLLPWLVENGFGLMYSIVTTVIVVIAMASNVRAPSGSAILTFIVVILPVLFSAYVWSAVYSLYNWLAEVDNQRARLLGPQGIGKTAFYQTYERV